MPSAEIRARIAEHIEPIDRGDRYEDPLDAFLQERELGTVTGGGTQLTEDGEIEWADVEIELRDVDASLADVVAKLEALGAPAGSCIEFDPDTGRAALPFGTLEVLVVYLDGVNLPDDVYAALDFEALYTSMADAVREQAGGEARSVWTGNTETAIHFTGASADALAAVVRSMWDEVPVLQNARLVCRYADGRERGEQRLPMR